MLLFQKQLPDPVVLELKRLARRESGAIMIQMVKSRTDAATGEIEETTWPASAGTLRGISAMDGRLHRELRKELAAKRSDIIQYRTPDDTMTYRRANIAIKALSGVDDLVARSEHAEKATQAFLRSPDLPAMIYLVRSMSDRAAVYCSAMRKLGNPVHEADAAKAVNEMDRARIASQGADELRFPVV